MSQIERIIIYPSWGNFSAKWTDLPVLIENPTVVLSDDEAHRYKELGYTTNISDQTLLDGPGSGGLICLHRPFGRWLPAALFHSDAWLHPVPGFGMTTQIPVNFLVGKITAEHKMGLRPYPIAPTPLFSVERLEIPSDSYFVLLAATAGNSFRVILDRLRFWNSDLKIVETLPPLCADRFERIRRKEFNYLWCLWPSSDSLLDLAKCIHSCSFADTSDRPMLRCVHFLMSVKGRVIGEASAIRWQRQIRNYRTANDW